MKTVNRQTGGKSWFPPAWKTKGKQAKAITSELSSNSGFNIKPRIANNYPQILRAFDTPDQSLVFVGSFKNSST